MKRFIVVPLMAGVVLSALAEGEKWSLDSCINYAINHNISVRNSKNDRYSAELGVTEAKDAFLPQANAQAGQSFNFGRGLTSENTYANRNTTQTGWNVGVSVPLFQGLSAVRQLDYSKAYLKAVAEQVEATKDNVELQVIVQYLQVLYSGELEDVACEQKRLSEVQLERSRILVEEGKIPELELTQAEAQVAKDNLSVVNARNDRMLALLDLSQLLQLPSTDGFDVKPIADGPVSTLSADGVFTSAMQSNHGVLATRYEADAADRNIRLAQTGYLPRLSFDVGIGSSYYHLNGFTNQPFHRQMRDNFNTSLGFTLSIPLFDAFATRNRVRRAKVAKTTALLRQEEVSSNLYKSIQQAYFQAVVAENRLDASIVAERAAKAAFEAMEVKFEFGRANSTELEQVRAEYIKSRISTVQSRYELLLRRRILEFYNR